MGDKSNSKFEDDITFQIDYTANFNKSFRRRFSAKYIDAELMPDEFAIIYFVSNQPDISQTTLAKYLFKGKAHVGKILKEMEQKGLIKRTTAKTPAPSKIILLPKAKKIYEKGVKETRNMRERYEKEFSETEINQFLNFLKRYRNMLSSFVEVELK